MADLRVINILPSQPVTTVAQAPVTANQSAPSLVANLQVGSVLTGFIVNRDGGGNPILRTDSGDIAFESNFFLKIGSEVTIRIENTAGQSNAHILTVNGLAPEIAVLQSGLGQEPEVIVSQNLQNQPATTNAAANTVANTPANSAPTVSTSAVVITPAAVAQIAQTAPAGSQIGLKLVRIDTAQATPITETEVEIPNAVTAPKNSAPTATASPASTPYNAYARAAAATPSLPTAPVQTAPVATSAPTSAAPVANTAIPQTGEQITATVISHAQTGEATLQTPLGTLRLPAAIQLPIGSTVTFELGEIVTPEAQVAAAPLAATTPAPLPQLAKNWDSLQTIFTLLTGQTTSADAEDFLTNTLPTIGLPTDDAPANAPQQHIAQNLPSALMNFVVALKNNDFKTWLGRNNAKWLEDNGHGDLLRKAEGEFSILARGFSEPVSQQQWQSLFFPVAVNGEIQQARLFVKRDRKEKENAASGKKQDDTRFVVEVDMSQLGEIQMDGFVRRRESEIQFDLIIRSHTEFTPEMRNDILAIYNSTGELTGYKGGLAFQAVKDFPVNPMEDIASDDLRGVIA